MASVAFDSDVANKTNVMQQQRKLSPFAPSSSTNASAIAQSKVGAQSSFTNQANVALGAAQQRMSRPRAVGLKLTKTKSPGFSAKGLPGLGGSPQWSTSPGFKDKVFPGNRAGSLQGTSRAPRY